VDLPEVISIEEETDPWPRPRLSRRALGVAAAVVVVVAIGATAVLLLRGADDVESAGVTEASSARLELLSYHPLSNPNAERLLEERFLPVPDDDEADVTCSERVPRPAYSVRRCHVLYPGGSQREIIVVTNASGAEMLRER
jgi:hypothetical protein